MGQGVQKGGTSCGLSSFFPQVWALHRIPTLVSDMSLVLNISYILQQEHNVRHNSHNLAYKTKFNIM